MQVNAPLSEKTWGRAKSCFGCENKQWRTFHSFQEKELGEIIAKNIARTARTQLEGRHLLFGENFRAEKP